MKRRFLLAAALLGAFLLPVCRLCAHDDHNHLAEQSPVTHFLRENGLWLQIGGGVVLVASIAVFIALRLAKKPKNKDAQPPVPEKPLDAK